MLSAGDDSVPEGPSSWCTYICCELMGSNILLSFTFLLKRHYLRAVAHALPNRGERNLQALLASY